jgi:protein phosphatase
MRVRVGAASDIGQVREGNEDSFLLMDPLFAVADGMGGHRGGEVASELALKTIEDLFSAHEGSLTEQVERANRAVFERSQSDRAVSGMGTTLTAALVQAAQVRLAHVGDSRAYLFRDGELHLLTEDHTLVHRMVQEGEITEEEAENHPHRNIVTRALGVEGVVQVDEAVVEARPGDRILLCTDGLTGMVGGDEIAAVLRSTPDPQEAVELLVAAANRAGGIDNITAVIVDVADDGGGDEAAGDREVLRRPTQPHPVPSSRPAERTDVTVVGRPVPTRPPIDRGGSALARKTAIRAGAALAVFVVAVVGLRLYLDTQWYVGVSDGRVAIFRGIPAHVGGVHLSSVEVETTISAEEAESLAVYRDLADGITADDREGADAIVEQIRQDVAAVREVGT